VVGFGFRTRGGRAVGAAALAALAVIPGLGRGDAPASTPTTAIAKPLQDQWVRFRKGDDGKPLALETAIGRYEGTFAGVEGAQTPVVVELVGAVHVGDAAYYAQLNDRFQRYDALLYELVAPNGTRVPRGGRVGNENALGAMQNGMGTMLELEHQLTHIDYTKPNFVHADMSPDEMFATMKRRDESLLKLYFRLIGHSIAAQTRQTARGESAELDMAQAMFAKDRPRALKVAMAGQLSQIDSLLGGFGGTEGSTLIHERNRVAFDKLREQLGVGKKFLGVFYGAGHLNDMDERLREDFGLRQVSKEWVPAWDLAPNE
jgi:hypothetical protein